MEGKQTNGVVPPEGSITKGDPRFETLSQGFNQRFSEEPKYIRLIKNDHDAMAQLNLAIEKGLRPTVRGGGHCYEGFVDTDGVILDLSTMRGVYASEDVFGKPTYVVEGSATNWDIYTTLFREHGVTVPGGSCYSVGAGGHICGGGYGLLSRKHGLTVDHLVQIDVVTVRNGTEAEVTMAHRDDKDPHKKDLFWAHTGCGGGNFGVILRYHFAGLPRPPQNVWLSNIAWPWKDLPYDDFEKLLNNFGRFFAEHSGPEDPYNDLFSLLHLTHHSNGNITLVSQWSGDGDSTRVENFVTEIERGMTTKSTVQLYSAGDHFLPFPEKHRKMPWFQATMSLNGSGPNRRGKYKSAYHRKPFSPTQIKALWEWLKKDVILDNGDKLDLTQALAQIDSYGCKINARKSSDTAVPQRDSIMKLQYQTYWTDGADDAAQITYLRDLYKAVYPKGHPEVNGPGEDKDTDGTYVNYPDIDLGKAVYKDDEPWQTSDKSDLTYLSLYYGEKNTKKLRETKKYWDPKNHFRHAQSIPLPKQ